MKGLVLGVYTKKNEGSKEISEVTSAFEHLNKESNGKLMELVKLTGPFNSKSVKPLWTTTFPEIDFDWVSVLNLGPKDFQSDPAEHLDEKAEKVRQAVTDAADALMKFNEFETIYFDSCGYPKCVSEALALKHFKYLNFRKENPKKTDFQLYKYPGLESEAEKKFKDGQIEAGAQNFARWLTDTPANLLTATIYADTVTSEFKDKNVEVIVRDKAWIEEMKMGMFLSVNAGSDQPPKFLELHYKGSPDVDKCIALVGKGITFDSGGYSMKNSSQMAEMRGDMGGAACVTGTIKAIAELNLKVNVKGFMPLTDNMVNGSATKIADVITAMNGKTVQVDNTDAEGRLVLGDALCYAQKFKPIALIDVATLTGAAKVATGPYAYLAYSNDDRLWDKIYKAGFTTGQRPWRMPMFKSFKKQLETCDLADLNNVDSSKGGGSCIAAAFLSAFVEPGVKWMHLDTANVRSNNGACSYMGYGMTGNPTRALIEFVKSFEEEFQ